ncbi:FliM/FliN family flagellar motor switch protein [Pantoea sp. A4]|uniref:FliM/FliN family flagellar motor switch protein n=1 Tax=Pantoea sp. A4 TaxID=1225184 RepID=UPI00037F15BE|nr:FliM/FliN family flagellar motor switch protein [Pantoea sp. A4]
MTERHASDSPEEIALAASLEAAFNPVPQDTCASSDKQRHLALFSRIPVTLTLEVASVEVTLAELLEVNEESVIELDKLAGEPLDIKINGVSFGTAEVVVVNDKYALRVIEFDSSELSELAR